MTRSQFWVIIIYIYICSPTLRVIEIDQSEPKLVKTVLNKRIGALGANH